MENNCITCGKIVRGRRIDAKFCKDCKHESKQEPSKRRDRMKKLDTALKKAHSTAGAKIIEDRKVREILENLKKPEEILPDKPGLLSLFSGEKGQWTAGEIIMFKSFGIEPRWYRKQKELYEEMKPFRKLISQKKSKDNTHPHFVDATYPKEEPWKTNIYFGPRDKSGSYAHIVASGAEILYLRDMVGSEIIDNKS